jgi:acyl-CoA reductase-like NAD-dependent aldehyde dehydrogenase
MSETTPKSSAAAVLADADDGRGLARDLIAQRNLVDIVAQPGAEAMETLDPFSGELVAAIPSTESALVGSVVERAAQTVGRTGVWATTPLEERAVVLRNLAELIDRNYDAIAALESIDAGKLYAGTRGWDVGNARDILRFYAEEGVPYLRSSTTYGRARSYRAWASSPRWLPGTPRSPSACGSSRRLCSPAARSC